MLDAEIASLFAVKRHWSSNSVSPMGGHAHYLADGSSSKQAVVNVAARLAERPTAISMWSFLVRSNIGQQFALQPKRAVPSTGGFVN